MECRMITAESREDTARIGESTTDVMIRGMTRVTDRITARITGADMTAGTMGRMTEKDAQPDEKRKNISHL